MDPLSVVLYQSDVGTAQILAVTLSQHFDTVRLVKDCAEIRPAVALHRADAVVIDLEVSGTGEVEYLHREFPELCIVGTHRLADDKLWAEAMSLGASDICEPRGEHVVQSLLQGRARHIAA